MKDDTISRAAAIETVRKAQSIGQAHRMLLQMPSAQPSVSKSEMVGDFINRKAAIKTLMAAKTVDPSIVGCASNAGVDWCIDAIKALPSAQPTGTVFVPVDDCISRQAAKDYIDSQKGRPFIGCTIGEAMKIMLDEVPPAQQTVLTAEDIETIRIHLSAFKEELGNQGRWTEAVEYERLIQRLTREGGQDE